MDGRTAAAILGVTERARVEEIRAAFRARVKATHPDLGGDPAALGIALDAFNVLRNRATTVDESPAAPTVINATHGFAGFAGFDAPCSRRSNTRSFADELRVAVAREAAAPRR